MLILPRESNGLAPDLDLEGLPGSTCRWLFLTSCLNGRIGFWANLGDELSSTKLPCREVFKLMFMFF